eukprot:m.386519 g.386519  ORF g.386519 m.386519 type:complete len:467 (+) comp20054_c0_seq6:2915-4315(+)
MVKKITSQLLRKRAEHNNMELSTLEEISLHQENLERIEGIDQYCRRLKILYLQNNLIGKIENVGRLKELEYLNLALNNITRLENLQGCESLRKLDLTVNFIGDLTTVKSLAENRELRELYLTGNPCTSYEGYRDYVVFQLPQLTQLDGTAITRPERILAKQRAEELEESIAELSRQHEAEQAEKRRKVEEKNKPITDPKDGRWYTEPNAHIKTLGRDDDFDPDDDEANRKFWEEETEYTPEARIQAHRRQEAMREKQDEKRDGTDKTKPPKRVRQFFRDGKPLNMNEAGLQFDLSGHDATEQEFVLELSVYRYLDTSQIDLDVQPTYVRAVIKGKAFQLVLPEEINPDKSSAKRSQVSGHLMVTMPKAKPIVTAARKKPSGRKSQVAANVPSSSSTSGAESALATSTITPNIERLEVTGDLDKLDISAICKEKQQPQPHQMPGKRTVPVRENDDDFIDDDDVPPLM